MRTLYRARCQQCPYPRVIFNPKDQVCRGFVPKVLDSRSFLAGKNVGGLTWRTLRWAKSEALTLLYDESAASLLGLALKMVKNEADAEEVILEVYEQVWRTAHSFDPARASVWRWLTVLVREPGC